MMNTKKLRCLLAGLKPSFGAVRSHTAPAKKVDVLLIGSGIMSATLGVWLNELEPDLSMEMIERLDDVAQESSNGWNNAGTGHSALAELNYTPLDKHGKISISKAIEVNEGFQLTREFWSWQVMRGVLKNPRSFINSTPHVSFVWGEENVSFLKKRYEALQASPLFGGIQYSEDPAVIKQWVPLMLEGRDPKQKIAATWNPNGTDVNFGEVARQLIGYLQTTPKFALKLSSEVKDITRNGDGSWRVSYRNLIDGSEAATDARFLFIGAGGGALKLLQKSGIPEAREYAGFPVGGSFLVAENPAITAQHHAKAYGQASVGAPPMSVPHLDSRVLDGKRLILFGPFATFSTKFLKHGSFLDLLSTTTTHNVWPMTRVGIKQFPLVQYLAGQLMLSKQDRLSALKEYFPKAKAEDWRVWQAGQRVQIIKRDKAAGGVLKLGTEIVTSEDGTIATVLGASPGASTAVPIMVGLLQKVFKDQVATNSWQKKIHQILPSYGTQLNNNPLKLTEEWAFTARVLDLVPPPVRSSAAKPAVEMEEGKPVSEDASVDMAL